MRRPFQYAVLTLVPALLLACGDGGSASSNSGGQGGAGGAGGSAGGAGELPCDIDAIMKAKCQSCHAANPVYGAPMPLMTAADFQKVAISDPSKKVYELVGSRIHNSASPMPPPPKTLGASELAALDAWIAGGAAEGSCGGAGGGGAGGAGGGSMGLSCTPDTKIRAATAFTMPQATVDEYVCFGVDIPVASKKHITAIAPAIDNATIVHHILLFETDSSASPTPVPCGAGTPAGTRLISVWAPGGQALELPAEAGMPLEGTAHYLVQVHYSNLMQLAGQSDQSGFDLCTTTTLRPNDADIMAFGTTKISIPAHSKLDLTCAVDVPPGFPQVNVYGIMPHMHTFGTIISGDVQKAGGGNVVLTHREPWSFDSQYWDMTKTSIGPGDTVETRCVWENPSNSTVNYGEQTSNEMCFVFAAYWPRISLAQWNWMLPASSSTCKATP